MRRRLVHIAKRGVIASLLASVLSAAPAAAVGGFGDVGPDKFYSAPVQWMVDTNLTKGVSPGCFGPAQTTTRGEVATFLHRYAGLPSGEGESFVDVNQGDYFADAVAWMVSAGITKGASPTTFAPDRAITRGELATFLHRFRGEPNGGTEPFTDVHPTDFFADAVAWMVTTGVTTGTSPSTFDPHRPVTRGELATFLYRIAGSPSVALTAGGSCGATTAGDPLSTAEAFSWELLNESRAAVGLPPLLRNASMDVFARDWSDTMDASGSFHHSGGPYAENIAWWSQASATPQEAAERLHDLWVNSPGHYANMTGAGYTEVGIGFWQSSDGWHGAHVFG